MRDLISRQAAIDIASGYCGYCHPASIAKELAKLPSAQPEVIHCKDCKYADFGVNIFGVEYEFCTEWCRDGIEENGFCSRAERRKDG